MKRILLIIAGIAVIAISCVYIVIPSTIKISHYSFFSVPANSLVRGFNEYNAWNQWWPQDSLTADSSQKDGYKLNGISYEPFRRTDNGVAVYIKLKDTSLVSFIHVLNYSGDSVAVQWQAELSSGYNPFERINKYYQAKEIWKNMDTILNSYKIFTEDNKNIYGFHIERTTFMDTLFMIDRFTLDHIPSTDEIYNHINALRDYTKIKGADTKGYSMLNIDSTNSDTTVVTVAVCIDKRIREEKSFRINTMPINHNGNCVISLTGGQNTIAEAHKALRNYLKDYILQIQAMPFEQLINDRSKIPDTSQWETIVDYPCTPN